MASVRRIVVNVSTAVKQWRGIGIPQMARRINVSTNTAMLNLWKSPFIGCKNQNRDLSTNTATNDYDYFREIGYTDVADLLSTPERDFLLRNHDGQKVPVSSLKGKLVGLYLCENITDPDRSNRMEAIKKVYEEAKSRGYDFEIVQITFDFNAKHLGKGPIVEQSREDISWLTLPSMDLSFTKLQRIFQRVGEDGAYWDGDSLVLIHPPQAQAQADDGSDVLFEFSGVQILKEWGIEGYPFTRPSLYKAEYELQKREITLQSLFPLGEGILMRPRPGGDGFDLVDALSQLSGKQVLVLYAHQGFDKYGGNFVSMLKTRYEAQVEDNIAEESKFEVVYVSTGGGFRSSFDEFTKDMPWMVMPFPLRAYEDRLNKVFKPYAYSGLAAAVAFNEQGELIAKEDSLNEKKEGYNLEFPFIDPDLEKRIRAEVEELCDSRYY